ncbi:hypothetical protein [Streptomyces boluensis]|uniref:Uncharacterized protein n=1 Tax=Streptomyces boluensis TaxID=1775135 RepID=A0A964UMH5_9ACTN|nr:hypothetical protein [Streptomyces boluensis]NBE51959.1 hypothetical protein [Streptomyces boluensis]
MNETTPYDEDRGRFSRSGLARLVLSDRSVALARTADNLAVTRYDAYTGPGGRVSEAKSLAGLAGQLLAAAVVYERERGSSWEEIAAYLGVDAAAAEARFAPETERWDRAFEVPYVLDETGRKRVPQLPEAAYDPENACRRLDLSAHLRLRGDDKHAVSAGVRAHAPLDEASDPALHDMEGTIQRAHLEAFVQLLTMYVHGDLDGADADVVARGLAGTDGTDHPGGWFTHSLSGTTQAIELRVAHSPGGDGEVVSVVVAGAQFPDLRLRVDTLLSAFAPEAWH